MALSNVTTRYIGDNDPIKLALSDDGVLRTDLADADSITVKFINQTTGSTVFSGPGDAIDDPELNVQYDVASGDTAAAESLTIGVTVINSGVTATYAPGVLTIKQLI